jgi:PAS domain S-box-containing protein
MLAHVGLEAAALALSSVIGALALVRYYSRKDATLLFIGTGFVGTAVLEFHHLVVSTPILGWTPAGSTTDVMVWSWIASRLFLSLFLFVAWLAWRTEGRRDPRDGEGSRFDEVSIYITASVLTVVIFGFFSWADVAAAHMPNLPIRYPVELVPGMFFTLAFFGFYTKGTWANDLSEHWLVLALLVSAILHILYAAPASGPLDAHVLAAHALKVVSYLCVLIGLLGSVYITFRRESVAYEFSRHANEALAREVAVRRQAEAVLQENEERLQDFLDSATDLIHMTRADGGLVYANRAWRRTLGMEEADLDGSNLLEMVEPEFRRAVEEAYARALGGESVSGLEFKLRTATGDNVVVRGSMNCRFEEGRPVSVRSVMRDVTEQVHAAEELARSEANVTALVESTGDAIWSVDPHHHLITYNAAFGLIIEAMVGREPGVGDLPEAYLPPEDAPRFREYFTRALYGERFSEVWMFDLAGQPRAFELYFNPIAEGFETTGVVVFGKDVTRRVRAEEALRAAKEEAEHANQAKSQFLAKMSHELRTPLNSVIGFSNILVKRGGEAMDPKDRSFVERITANGKHLLGLINEVLDLAKIESGKMDLELEEVHLDEFIPETLEQLEGQVRGRPVALVADVPDGVDPLRTDPGKLRQVLINLVGNAIKFTQAGSVTVRVDTLIEHPRTAYRVAVVDTGPGIPQDRLDAIFEAFQQADSSTSREYGGTGLGLSISRSLCNLLGYHITVASEVGDGSTFTINLNPRLSRPETEGDLVKESVQGRPKDPRASAPGGNRADGDGVAASMGGAGVVSEPLVRPRVLVIDAEPESRAAMSQALLDIACEVFTAEGDEAGIQRIRALRPDLLVLILPRERRAAWEALQGVSGHAQAQKVPLILVDQQSRPGFTQSFGSLSVLRESSGSGALREAVAGALESVGADGMSVALVEPDALERDRIASLLRASGLRVVSADAGSASSGHATLESPSLALVRGDASAVADRLRGLPGLAGLPVVALTGQEPMGDVLGPEAQELMEKVYEALGHP